eukprot:scaffold16861_cov101-Isochrysis_galbana.AAC.5
MTGSGSFGGRTAHCASRRARTQKRRASQPTLHINTPAAGLRAARAAGRESPPIGRSWYKTKTASSR